MTKLTNEEALIALYETAVEYRADIVTAMKSHVEILKTLEKSYPNVEVSRLMLNQTRDFTPFIKKVEELGAFIEAMTDDYLKLTKPMKH